MSLLFFYIHHNYYHVISVTINIVIINQYHNYHNHHKYQQRNGSLGPCSRQKDLVTVLSLLMPFKPKLFH